MKRCIECGRPYRGGLNGSALLELALNELREGELDADHPGDLARMRELVRKAANRLDRALEKKAASMAGG